VTGADLATSVVAVLRGRVDDSEDGITRHHVDQPATVSHVGDEPQRLHACSDACPLVPLALLVHPPLTLRYVARLPRGLAPLRSCCCDGGSLMRLSIGSEDDDLPPEWKVEAVV